MECLAARLASAAGKRAIQPPCYIAPREAEERAMKRREIERLFYGEPEHQRRFTQDFPILPDVWIEYGKNPAGRVELLLTPHNESDSATLARALRQRLADEPQAAGLSAARVLYNESVVL